MNTESRDNLMPKEQINVHLKQSKNQKQRERKEKIDIWEMLFLFTIIVNIMIWSTAIGDLLPFSPPGIHQHNQDVGLDNLCFMQTQITCMHLGCSRPLDQISFCPALSGTKSEINGHTSSSKESSYASNPVQYIESLHGSPFEVLEETINERREKLSPITGKFKDVDMSPLVEFCHPVSALEQVQHSENEVEAHNEVKGVSAGIPTDLDSSNLHESSCMSYVVDEISQEATNFCQL